MPESNENANVEKSLHNWGHRRFVTVRAVQGHDAIDLEMPGDQPINVLIPDLIKILNWPSTDADRPLFYRLRTDSGKVLSQNETLNDAGVENSDVLWLFLRDPDSIIENDLLDEEEPTGEMEQETKGKFETMGGDQDYADRNGFMTPPREARLSITQPCLVSAAGRVYILGTPPILIGRKSRDHQPDIDLTELDEEFTSSRRHAVILREGKNFFLMARETINGTFVNGAELPPGEKRILEEGNSIQFGFEGVELRFFTGTEGSLPASFFVPKNP